MGATLTRPPHASEPAPVARARTPVAPRARRLRPAPPGRKSPPPRRPIRGRSEAPPTAPAMTQPQTADARPEEAR